MNEYSIEYIACTHVVQILLISWCRIWLRYEIWVFTGLGILRDLGGLDLTVGIWDLLPEDLGFGVRGLICHLSITGSCVWKWKLSSQRLWVVTWWHYKNTFIIIIVVLVVVVGQTYARLLSKEPLNCEKVSVCVDQCALTMWDDKCVIRKWCLLWLFFDAACIVCWAGSM